MIPYYSGSFKKRLVEKGIKKKQGTYHKGIYRKKEVDLFYKVT